ncbi:MAG: SigB/SigF/SigG family RNA polymerase sigma factor [Bacilli bacterium]|nr:SigB/SigF/SigG family RNA polymerase sigma factor [Bacilli bacterium]
MSQYKVEISGINTNDLKALTNEKMNELFKLLKNGKQEVRDYIVEGNLKLVLSIIRKMNVRSDNMDDLFQIGCIGLLKAIDNFDLSYNVKFSTYAVPMIMGEIRRYIRDNNQIRISRSVKDIAFKIVKMKEEFYSKNGYEMSTKELEEKLNVSQYEIANALESLKDPISIFEPIYNDGGDTILLYDQIEDKKSSKNELSSKLALEKAINDLDKRENFILNQRYIVGKTQMEIAKELDISQAQVSRLEKGAIKQLQKVLK